MTNKHTPGPWLVTPLGDIEAKEAHICQINQSMFNNQYKELTTHLEAQANARLIAASPDLLYALTLLAKNIDLGKLNVKKDFELMNAHANALKVLHKLQDEKS